MGNQQIARRAAGITLAAGLAAALAGCGGGANSASATVVCGTTLAHSTDPTVIVDATAPPPLRVVRNLNVDGLLIVRVADCVHGDDLVIEPGSAAHITGTAASKDGRTAAVVLRPVPNASFHVRGKGPNAFDLPVAIAPKGFRLPFADPTH
ncbi:MAG TPA: hypothetical protein VHV82_10840 [Sporichthyaceae bacterium]|nr:hypothetical protein [Sporichthyaceae bacterium]